MNSSPEVEELARAFLIFFKNMPAEVQAVTLNKLQKLVKPAAQPGMREPWPSDSEVIAFCREWDWMFRKARDGGYNYRMANAETRRFLESVPGRSSGWLVAFLEFVSKEVSPGVVSVRPGMWDELADHFNRR